MQSVKVTFNDDCRNHQDTVTHGQRTRERDTDDLGQGRARLGGDQSDQVEGEGLVIEVPLIPGQYDATGGMLVEEDPRRRRLPGP